MYHIYYMKLLIILLLVFIIFLILSSISNKPLISQTKSELTYSNYILPKKIFCYWNDYSNNPIINEHIMTWKKHVPSDWQINIIDSKNLHNFASKEFIDKYNYLNPVRFSDFLRLELLLNNGGVWLDASVIISNGAFLDTFYNEMITKHYDATLFELTDKTNMKHAPYLENWFIMAPKNSKLIKDLYTEFIKSENIGFLNYKNNILLPSGISLSNTIGYEDSTYLMQHAIINFLFHKKPSYYNVNIKDSYDSMFKIHNQCNWDHRKIIEFIINNKDWSKYYAIKLTSSSRNYITDKNINQYITNIRQI